MKSAEYPDLDFVRPRSYTPGRPDRVRVIVIHTTEGHEDQYAAENGAHNDSTRVDGTSCHYFHDPDSTVQCVLTTDRAHSALPHGNAIGVHHELCGTAGQGAKGWADSASLAIIRRAAKQAARDATKYGIPVRRLTSAEVRNGALGFCGHNEITLAFPEDKGTHWDPGTDFPWAQFLSLVEMELNGDTMSDAELISALLAREVNSHGLKVGVALEDASDAAAAATRIEAVLAQLVARPAVPAPSTTTVVLAPDQLEQLAAKVAAKLAGGFELAFRPATV